jgi:hypothetical protein
MLRFATDMPHVLVCRQSIFRALSILLECIKFSVKIIGDIFLAHTVLYHLGGECGVTLVDHGQTGNGHRSLRCPQLMENNQSMKTSSTMARSKVKLILVAALTFVLLTDEADAKGLRMRGVCKCVHLLTISYT